MAKSTPPNWDLKDFYSGLTDPKIEKDKKIAETLTSKFIRNYKSKINTKSLTADFFLKALTDYEKIVEKVAFLTIFANNIFSTNTTSSKIKNFYQKSDEFSTKINTQILWFPLEWINLEEKIAGKLINSHKLKDYKHYLIQTRSMKPFTLSEKEEQIMSQKAQTSNSAFVRLYDQSESVEKFEITIKGKKKILNSSQIGAIMKNDPDRKLREEASLIYGKTYSKNSNLYGYILNTLILDKKINDEIRKFDYPQQATFIEYEVKPKAVENMSRTVSNNIKIVEKFYLTKKKLLKVDKLYEWDRYSSIYNIKSKIYSWENAKEIVLECFKDFSPLFYDTAKLFFDNNWIDAKTRNGKKGGAYCSLGIPNSHPVILMNFTGKINDVTTLAHELGHGIHAYLSRKNKLLQFYPSTATTEIASTFAESLVFEKLYKETLGKKEKINLLAEEIQGKFATIFRQNDFYVFETKIHELRRSEGELPVDKIGKLYLETLQKTFGKGLILSKNHMNFWMPILHFFHYNFYVFSYVFGELLATSVFAKYKLDKESFVKNYTEALSKGGSLNPYEITKIMGIDIENKSFWKNGIALIEKEVDEFVKLTQSS